MKKRSATKRVDRDPCLPIQLDLSCMMDGELDVAAVRRVLIHVEVCPRCREFFGDLRHQVQTHRDAWSLLERGLKGGLSRTVGSRSSDQRRLQLARVFYELGKAYILFSFSPAFRREVSDEPVPIPDVRLRGREILDEFLGSAPQGRRAQRWVQARSLLNGHLDSELDNLDKGTHLLEESLVIKPRLFEARIYLGHARNLGGDLEAACEEFRQVLREAKELLMRGYALENLGNTYLQLGELDHAARCFRRVVQGGIVDKHPRFFTSWFNLGLTYALQEDFVASMECFQKLYQSYSIKHNAVRDILAGHQAMADLLMENSKFRMSLEKDCPDFFAVR